MARQLIRCENCGALTPHPMIVTTNYSETTHFLCQYCFRNGRDMGLRMSQEKVSENTTLFWLVMALLVVVALLVILWWK